MSARLDFDRPGLRLMANELAGVLAECAGKPRRPHHDFSRDPDDAVFWGSAQAALAYVVERSAFELLARERNREVEDDGA